MQKISSEESCALVAVIDDRIIGYLVGGFAKVEEYRSAGKTAELENMYVIPKYRSMRIGNKLINKFLSWCKSKDVERTRVITSANNKLAIGFYHKNGFSDYNLILEKRING
jgi:ribosomal protein S18 acetylase RimI-like enzyme